MDDATKKMRYEMKKTMLGLQDEPVAQTDQVKAKKGKKKLDEMRKKMRAKLFKKYKLSEEEFQKLNKDK